MRRRLLSFILALMMGAPLGALLSPDLARAKSERDDKPSAMMLPVTVGRPGPSFLVVQGRGRSGGPPGRQRNVPPGQPPRVGPPGQPPTVGPPAGPPGRGLSVKQRIMEVVKLINEYRQQMGKKPIRAPFFKTKGALAKLTKRLEEEKAALGIFLSEKGVEPPGGGGEWEPQPEFEGELPSFAQSPFYGSPSYPSWDYIPWDMSSWDPYPPWEPTPWPPPGETPPGPPVADCVEAEDVDRLRAAVRQAVSMFAKRLGGALSTPTFKGPSVQDLTKAQKELEQAEKELLDAYDIAEAAYQVAAGMALGSECYALLERAIGREGDFVGKSVVEQLYGKALTDIIVSRISQSEARQFPRPIGMGILIAQLQNVGRYGTDDLMFLQGGFQGFDDAFLMLAEAKRRYDEAALLVAALEKALGKVFASVFMKSYSLIPGQMGKIVITVNNTGRAATFVAFLGNLPRGMRIVKPAITINVPSNSKRDVVFNVFVPFIPGMMPPPVSPVVVLFHGVPGKLFAIGGVTPTIKMAGVITAVPLSFASFKLGQKYDLMGLQKILYVNRGDLVKGKLEIRGTLDDGKNGQTIQVVQVDVGDGKGWQNVLGRVNFRFPFPPIPSFNYNIRVQVKDIWGNFHFPSDNKGVKLVYQDQTPYQQCVEVVKNMQEAYRRRDIDGYMIHFTDDVRVVEEKQVRTNGSFDIQTTTYNSRFEWRERVQNGIFDTFDTTTMFIKNIRCQIERDTGRGSYRLENRNIAAGGVSSADQVNFFKIRRADDGKWKIYEMTFKDLPADRTPPRVVSTFPAQGSTGISVNLSQIRITWNEDMGRGFRLGTPENLTCTDPSYNASTKTFTFPCKGPLNASQDNDFFINPELRSLPPAVDTFGNSPFDFFADAFGNKPVVPAVTGIVITFTTAP